MNEKRKNRTSSEAVKKWQKAHIMRFGITVSRDTEQDIIQRLNEQYNKSGYIKALIKKDIQRSDYNMIIFGKPVIGIEQVVEDTYGLNPNDHAYVELFYDSQCGEVWTRYQYSVGMNNWTVYHDDDIIKIANINRQMSAIEIVNLIVEYLENLRRYRHDNYYEHIVKSCDV